MTLEQEFVTEANKLLRQFGRDINRQALRDALDAGDYDTVERIVGLERSRDNKKLLALIALLALFMLRAYQEAAKAEADALGIPFNPAAPGIAAWVHDRAVNEALTIMQNSRDTLAGIISRGHSGGMDATELAAAIAGAVWLTDRQAGAIDAQRAAMQDEDGLSDAAVDAAVARAQAGGTNHRALLIAVWLITAAVTAAHTFIWLLGVTLGIIDPRKKREMWQTAHDERVCSRCGPMDGVTREIGAERWPTRDGEFRDGPPAHQICRCRTILVNA